MRLERVNNGHRIPFRLFLKVMGLMSGHEAPDVVRTLYYRPEMFGLPFSELVQDIMRGESEWTSGEREIFAAFTAKQNKCLF